MWGLLGMTIDRGPRPFCPLCCGIGGWNKDTGKPRTSPSASSLKDELYFKCLLCRGTGRL